MSVKKEQNDIFFIQINFIGTGSEKLVLRWGDWSQVIPANNALDYLATHSFYIAMTARILKPIFELN